MDLSLSTIETRTTRFLNDILTPCYEMITSTSVKKTLITKQALQGRVYFIVDTIGRIYTICVYTTITCYSCVHIGTFRDGKSIPLYRIDYKLEEDFDPDQALIAFENILREREPDFFIDSCHLK